MYLSNIGHCVRDLSLFRARFGPQFSNFFGAAIFCVRNLARKRRNTRGRTTADGRPLTVRHVSQQARPCAGTTLPMFDKYRTWPWVSIFFRYYTPGIIRRIILVFYAKIWTLDPSFVIVCSEFYIVKLHKCLPQTLSETCTGRIHVSHDEKSAPLTPCRRPRYCKR